MKKVEWIPETIAAEKVGLRPRTLRKYAKSGKIAINYTAPRGRSFQYVKEDIDKYLLEFSTLTA